MCTDTLIRVLTTAHVSGPLEVNNHIKILVLTLLFLYWIFHSHWFINPKFKIERLINPISVNSFYTTSQYLNQMLMIFVNFKESLYFKLRPLLELNNVRHNTLFLVLLIKSIRLCLKTTSHLDVWRLRTPYMHGSRKRTGCPNPP